MCGIIPQVCLTKFHTFPTFPPSNNIGAELLRPDFIFFSRKMKKIGGKEKFGTDFVYSIVTYIISVSTFIRFYRLSLTLKGKKSSKLKCFFD